MWEKFNKTSREIPAVWTSGQKCRVGREFVLRKLRALLFGAVELEDACDPTPVHAHIFAFFANRDLENSRAVSLPDTSI